MNPNHKGKTLSLNFLGFYKQKALFFVAVIVAGFLIYGFAKENNYSADSKDAVSISSNSPDLNVSVEVKKDGKILVDGKDANKEVDFAHKELRLLILDVPERYYNTVTVSLTLPAEQANIVSPHCLAIHGVEMCGTKIKDSRTILYQASGVSPYASITIQTDIPDGMVKPNSITKSKYFFLGLKGQFWVLIGVFIPIVTFLLMISFLFYHHKRQRIDIPEKETPVPPMAIPPAVVGALVNQKIGPREIAATLVDLAYRGDIVILDRERGFAFGKGRFDQRLLAYEKILLSKIFRDNLSSDRREIEKRVNDHFYSKKMSMVSVGITALATRLGYFKSDPHKSLSKYRLMGALAFLVATGGFTLSMIKFTDPPYIVFFWVGMMISALIIIYVAGKFPIRTAIGQEVLSNWLAFKKFLSNPEQFPFSPNNQQIFQKYLPYAIVLNCESAWAKRFENHSFLVPDWFLTDKSGLGLEDFCLALFPIVSFVGRSLAAIREPGFE